ncbi:hypothetical protein [Methylobacterium sp. Leaf112]|uniref:hypothetical protein n=1 Tax=Methylobacterium sp. Leaf112 TaxID=1736258 RepID=UPI0012E8859E|nr:hypothetical protein [Methylobacterium sp. Leaf112]
MFFRLMTPAVRTVLLTTCGLIVATSPSAAETSIFSRQAAFVDRGAISLDDASCLRQNCFTTPLFSAWDYDRGDPTYLFGTKEQAAQGRAAPRTTTVLEAPASNSLRSTRGDGAMLSTQQIGTGNRILSVQDSMGFALNAVFTQAGQDNQITGLQQGGFNIAIIAQSGSQNISSFTQTGIGNTLTARQR